ncbi:hypothetical protein F444_07034 [Phytophthora nicotianae P1976]|uniref:Uncharacterized protein n=1 Tax=Phytophthora nicotianae P1976 TaxID=1317066 RepID=A0A081AG24_PHYNI|nr:hypothetical protein F444_07034 [Phytophthora nicotianae P1976]
MAVAFAAVSPAARNSHKHEVCVSLMVAGVAARTKAARNSDNIPVSVSLTVVVGAAKPPTATSSCNCEDIANDTLGSSSRLQHRKLSLVSLPRPRLSSPSCH